MSTERLPFNLNSLIPETCKTKAEAFARCLHHKLLSLKRIDASSETSTDDSTTRLNNETHERLKAKNFLPEKSEHKITDKNSQISEDRRQNSGKVVKTDDSDEEFFSHSESDTSDLSENKNQKAKPIMVSKQKLTSMSSEESTVESWGSCQENLTDFEKLDSETEELNGFGSQIKGSPKLKNLKIRCKKKEMRDKSWKRNSKKSHSSSTESVDTEARASRLDPDPHSNFIFLHDLEDNEVPHRILRESSSTSNLEKHFSESFEEISTLKSRNLLKNDKKNYLSEKSLTSPSLTVNKKDEEVENIEKSEEHVPKETTNLEDLHRLKFAEEGNLEGIEFCELSCLDDFDTNKSSGSVKIVGGIVIECKSTDQPESKIYADFEDLTINTVEVLQEGDIDVRNQEQKKVELCEVQETQTKVAEDEEMLNDRAKLRRCSSLKTWKTPPGTPGAKKIVRFADALGLDLTDVRTFLDEIPKIPSSAYEDLRFEAPPDAEPLHPTPITPTLIPLFQQPVTKIDFLEKVQLQKICLESAVVTDTSVLTVTGYIRVQNVSFQKSVFVRYSLNNWKTFSDLQATYVPNSCDGFSDKFSFSLYGHTLGIGERLEFALRLDSCGSQYWDNNGGINYVFNCLPLNSTNTFFSPLDKTRAEPWPDFY